MKKKSSFIIPSLFTFVIFLVCLYVAHYIFILGLVPAMVLWGGGEMTIFLAILPYVGAFGPYLLMIMGALVSMRLGKKVFPTWLKWLILIIFFFSAAIPMVTRKIRLTKQLEESRKNAERHDGENIRYFKGTNKISYIVRYKNGKQHGKQEYFYENGQLETVKTYINGKINGTEIDYHENGKVRCVSEYSMGISVGRHYCLYEDGNLKNEFFYENGLQIKKTLYNPDGSVRY